MKNNCLIISHRGANRIAPQNTLDAFKHSIMLNSDGLETDVHLTYDGIPVICHNYDIKKTSNGNGLINNISLQELKNYDFGSYFHHSYRGTTIPTLDEFLGLCCKGNLKVINIEIKPPKNNDYSVVSKVIDSVIGYGLFNILLISSFDSKVLIESKKYNNKCRTGFLYSPDKLKTSTIIKDPVAFAKSINADALHPHKVLVNKRLIIQAHDSNILVNPWTINTTREINRMIKLGVDGIITDVPYKVKKLLSNYE